ncbi:MAG TPA: N-acetyl-gamma-glutamyl-phosphate reductase [Candidatus Limnocylindrales bacterium]|jgi:N-acetyl-gamma-glutamyl-phosphate reductase, common form|nr:N-acetyl-gamma-glutamyl-phosphate reductase [Candidatus Limnocylindrales bacterium]
MTATRSTPDGVATATPVEGSASARAGGAAQEAGSGSTAGPVGALGPKAAGTRSGSRTITVGIVGATGYAGGELVRLLLRHPNVHLAGLYGRNRDKEPIAASHPHLGATGLVIDRAIPDADAIFTALPHGAAAEIAGGIVARGSALLDVGPDFRLHDPADYPRWYKFEHPAPELLAQAVYGLPELHREEIREAADRTATIIGLPGCYSTATILTLAPLARAGLIADLAVDAKSGVSGAGREPKSDLLFSEVNESVRAYSMFSHRHTAEMEQELGEQGERGAIGSRDANPGVATVDFLPHLIPMTRGILASCHVRTTRPVTQAELDALYGEAYRDEPFVQIVADPPATKHVLGSNLCRIWVRVDPRSGKVLALGVIDNLVKGAAGQAVQALNVLFGLPEAAGLEQYPIAP